MTGLLLALAVHMFGTRLGLDLGGLWQPGKTVATGAALAWWMIATAGFAGGYITVRLMNRAVAGQLPRRMRQFLTIVVVLVLTAAGQAASAPGAAPSAAGLLTGLIALTLGSVMAFCGAHFATRDS